LAERGGTGAGEIDAGIRHVRGFIEKHGSTRFATIGEGDVVHTDERTMNRAGFRRRNADGQWEYLVLPEAWKDELCPGVDAKALAGEMAARGLLMPSGDKDKRLDRKEYIPGLGRLRVFRVLPAILSGSVGDIGDVGDMSNGA
jgi:hypothetical protein